MAELTESVQQESDVDDIHCDLCAEQCKVQKAQKTCKECDEMFCNDCSLIHTSQKYAKSHCIIDITETKETEKNTGFNSKQCEPCNNQNKEANAVKFCEECEEYLCMGCSMVHSSQKRTKSHMQILVDQKRSAITKSCEPCLENGIAIQAVNACKECEEAFCEKCSIAHKSQKATKGHTLVENLDDAQNLKSDNFCEPCTESGLHIVAPQICVECEEFLCRKCASMHKIQKATKTHKVIFAIDIPVTTCEPCSENNKNVPAERICEKCEEALCSSCVTQHKSQKATKHHILLGVKFVTSNIKLCSPCACFNFETIGIKYCAECDEYYCEKCGKRHAVQKATKTHKLIDSMRAKVNTKDKYKAVSQISSSDLKQEQQDENKDMAVADKETEKNIRPGKPVPIEEKPTSISIQWAPPYNMNESSYYQIKYKEKGKRWKVYEHNPIENSIIVDKLQADTTYIFQVRAVTDDGEEGPYSPESDEINTKKDDENDLKPGKPNASNQTSDSITIQWDEPPNFVESSCYQIRYKKKGGEWNFYPEKPTISIITIQNLQADIAYVFQVRTVTCNGKEGPYSTKSNEISTQKALRPGQPKASDEKSDSLSLHWQAPRSFVESSCYQIRYKKKGGKWQFYPESPSRATITIHNLQAESEYIFQVRVITDNGEEWPYSSESAEIYTRASLASRLLQFTEKVRDGQPAIYQLLGTEIIAARNEDAKTRKFEIGESRLRSQKEKTILLVGATGSGKSTLVDGFINYVTGVNWKDPYRFSLVNLEKEERNKNQAFSQTEWITCYVINPEEGSRLNYRLNIIDTPGFGDTRGLDRDNEIVKQLKELFSSEGQKGVVFIDSVCFLTKAPDARLTHVQKYIFLSIQSLFGKDIEKNICTLITFADGKDPPVLAAMQEAKLPFDSWYVFNNSGLFASNDESKSNLAPMFWDMGNRSFKQFFDSLEQLPTKSLQQTKQVLHERERLEVTIQSLQLKVDAGLNKLHELKQEINILKKHEKDISDNKDFVYEVVETKQVKTELPEGRYTTNCLHCHITCHGNCAYPNDEDKRKCCVMRNGKCTVCDNKCDWTQHANTAYIFTYESVTVQKTYKEKMKMYKKAGEKKVSHEEIVNRMMNEVEDLGEAIQAMMEQVNECNNTLKEIALQPNPLSMTEHIDLMIEGEKMEKKDGFQERIKILQGYRKKAMISHDVKKWEQEVESTSSLRGVQKPTNQSSKKADKKDYWQKVKGFFS